IPALWIADGRTAEVWTTAVLPRDDDSGKHVRVLADAAANVTGPLLCTAQSDDGNPRRVCPPVAIFDGWHRAAAWITQIRRGRTYAISGYLIVTQHRVPLWTP